MGKLPALIVFARAPIAGEAKTRLAPALGHARAAELYRCFVLDTLEVVSRAPAHLLLAAADARHLAAVGALAEEVCPEAEIIAQHGRDLGERIANALGEAFARAHPCAVVIGTDAPTLPLQRICEALDLVAQRDLVLGPCFDGGYYLIGMRTLIPEVLRDIAWSSDSVLLDTLRRARECQASVSLLEPWYDVDTPDDIEVLRAHLSGLSLAGQHVPCPRTWDCLRQWEEEEGG